MNGLGVGQADILDRHAHDSAGEKERVLAGDEHAREVVESCVRIGTAHRLMKSRDEIVVPLLRLVVDRCAPLHRLNEALGIERRRAWRDRREQVFDHVQEVPAIAVGEADEGRLSFSGQRNGPFLERLGAGDE